MWSSKWVLANLLTDFDTVKDALHNVAIRTYGPPDFGSNFDSYTIKDVFSSNIGTIQYPLVYAILIIAFVIFLYKLISRKYCFKFNFSKNIALLFISILPFIYMCIIQQHSIIHPFLTHRNLSLTIMVIIYILLSVFVKKTEFEITEK